MSSGTWSGPARSPTTRSRRYARYAGRDEVGFGDLPGHAGRRGRAWAHPRLWVAGRWSATRCGPRSTLAGGKEATGTEQRAALATTLLERHGVVTRDSVAAEGVRGGFGAVYPVYREMEERGRVRRGYFIEGLGGAQFAIAGAVDRLRSMRREVGAAMSAEARTLLLAATDPANPYGAALPWPREEKRHQRSPSRVAGAYVVLHDGDLVLYLERGAKSLQTFTPFEDRAVAAAAVDALRGLLDDGRLKRLQLERVDGGPVAESAHRDRLAELGFRQSYRGYVLGPLGGSASGSSPRS